MPLVFLLLSPTAVAQDAFLGQIDFPNSGPEEAQEAFIEGVLWMHSFEYARAAEAFREAQRVAPGFALAYWGEAMTHNHPIWFRQNREAAQAILARLAPTPEERIALAPTERERAWLEAVEILFGEGTKARRDTLYSEHLRAMHEQWPDDDEVAAFYALSLLGTSHGGRDIPTYMRAAAVAEEVFMRNPGHPGALHYLIHSYDDPIHAPLGLRAARRYAVIAGDAPHAQHMTTHIFVALGMWDDVVAHNEIASGPDPDAWIAGHYTWWLGYGYLQQGRFREAEALVNGFLSRKTERTPMRQRAHLARMRAELAVNTGRWDHPVLAEPYLLAADATNFAASLAAAESYVRGRAALAADNPESASPYADALATSAAEAEEAADANDPTPGVARVMELQLRGLIDVAAGNEDRGMEQLREALTLEQSLPFEFGPPLVVVPSGELLGEVLLTRGEARAAADAFQATLAVAPGRSASLLGLARAWSAAGDEDRAGRAYEQLLENWHRADDGIPGRDEAQ
jgi:hypothetical protein